MRYRITCLTPTLIGDGNKLAPIDYMLWKDQINVLDQNRILKMLAKSPRLDTYLAQIRKADRLSFSEWGGYAQNYAQRRIPLEHLSIAAALEKAPLEALHIPTFCSGASGVFIPGSALKGALRTALVWSRWNERGVDQVLASAAGKIEGNRIPRNLARSSDAANPEISIADGSQTQGELKIYSIQTARLQNTLTWKDSLPNFAEMASTDTQFEGCWTLKQGKQDQAFEAANRWSITLLDLHLAYARQANLPALIASLEELREKAASVPGNACVLSIGWGTGFLGKAAALTTSSDAYRSILRALPIYSRAIQTGLPFPKTRRVVHLDGLPAALPGWVLLESIEDVVKEPAKEPHDTLN